MSLAPTEARRPARGMTVTLVCLFTYLFSYLSRNLLTVFKPSIVAAGLFGVTETAALSSVYLFAYASGQLLFGFVGDRLSARYIVPTGLSLASAALLTFAAFPIDGLSYAAFLLLGLGLSMLRGPIVRLISANTSAEGARLGNLFLSVISFVGPLTSGLFVLILDVRESFAIVGGLCLVTALLFVLFMTVGTRRGLVKEPPPAPRGAAVTAGILRRTKLPVFLLLAMIVEVTATSVNDWLTLYMTEQLLFDEGVAATIYGGLSAVRAGASFLCLPLFRLCREDEGRASLVAFSVGALAFLTMLLTPGRFALVPLLVAEMACSVASAVLWSIYLPSFAMHGCVSTVGGVLDATGYATAALCNLLFALILQHASYEGLILAWGVAAAIGALLGVPAIRRGRHADGEDPA